ncbi:glucose-6-phosphate dehydrogenase [Aliicoccus persicus]|uniref:Glucose-6-phosphate 1-dehydrogenase n=1 Tax=Aliicoccus persicus TaxID=930138 RepID=A0A662Z3A0_9STAP|nr:glucose-6-phosphate dehydrogenase [Aliicoccus persicus]SEV83996.1 glucose-6-phosphate 1-dehydrogenase [Aliicoccus persicus]
MRHNPIPATILLFGSTGDLSKRKLIPSIFHLFQEGSLSEQFVFIPIGRKDISNDEYKEIVKASIQAHDKITSYDKIDEFLSHVYYQQVDNDNLDDFIRLNKTVREHENSYQTEGNRLFYFALPPSTFSTVSDRLRDSKITETNGFKRLIIEKPFGKDLESATALSEAISTTFDESEIYRIDHYLGKEMVQNIEVIRFSNSMFEPLWNNHYISNVQITSSESLGVLDRGNYYDQSGVVRDMFQNHMLQMVSLLAMEPPSTLSSEDIRLEKVKVLKSIRRYKPEEIKSNFIRGQYDEGTVHGEPVIAYRDEKNVADDSNTPTFIAARLYIDNFRWAGVPFYVRTGKSMKDKRTQIVVEFKEVPRNLYHMDDTHHELAKNLLVINIQPDESISLHLNVKNDSRLNDTKTVNLSYTVETAEEVANVDAYENLIYDCLNGDSTNFTHLDELMLAWHIVDPVINTWETDIAPFPNYRSGSLGPVKSQLLAQRDGYKWWDV